MPRLLNLNLSGCRTSSMLLSCTQHHFAVATPTKPRRAERVRSAARGTAAAAHITLRLPRLRYSAVLSAFKFAPRHPASLCGATPTTLRRAERVCSAAPRPASLCGRYAYDSPRRRVCCSAAGPRVAGRTVTPGPAAGLVLHPASR